MANRRMFSLRIVDTDNFLEMPTSTRLLYYDLAMRADDDGFVNSPQKIMKIVGATNDDFKILCAKQYIFPFESGICVIKDWKIHNYIQKDRYQGTIYREEFSQLSDDKNGAYTKCIQSVSNMDTQVSLELGKDRIETEINNCANVLFDKFWLAYPIRKSKEPALKSFKKINPSEFLLQKMIDALEIQKQEKNLLKQSGKFCPEWRLPSTWLNQKGWEDESSLNINNQNEVTNNANNQQINQQFAAPARSTANRTESLARMRQERIANAIAELAETERRAAEANRRVKEAEEQNINRITAQ